ncbi:PDZ domain-containing protein [Paenibacillus sp. HJGM_3]|uniref:YlbL family protein n=1 Tax=Paenibacillus sp. HJGM_3 TaxID=3379816 RepID=UPI00385A42E0
MSEDSHDDQIYRSPVHVRRNQGLRRFLLSFGITFAVLYLVYFVQVPYYIYQPGTAESIKPMVQVTKPDPIENGTFMLTTVSLIPKANVLSFLLAQWDENAEVQRKRDVLKGQSEQQYMQHQEIVMLESQSNAIQAAYKKANVPYQLKSVGAYVAETRKGLPAAEVLKPGDMIIRIDGKPIEGIKELQAALADKKVGDTVEVGIKRDADELSYSIVLADVSAATPGAAPTASPGGAGPKAGIGVTTADMRAVVPEQADKKVQIQAGEIGGPSAGLMFALEIYNQLTPGDLSKGYRIAGTGTIDPTGNVCSIGGIQHKIVAADREGVDVFFAPMDRKAGECGLGVDVANASDALQKAKSIDSRMKVISVGTIGDALNYLATLPVKPS